MHDRTVRCTAVLALGIGLVAACASKSSSSPAPEQPASEAPAADASTTEVTVWSEDLTHQQKAKFMADHVVPEMKEIFVAASAEHYADFGCKTCHGPNNQDPDEFLPRLTLKDGHLTAMESQPDVSKFMAEQVVPKMAGLMGQEPYNPETQQGFGCAGCHAIDML